MDMKIPWGNDSTFNRVIIAKLYTVNPQLCGANEASSTRNINQVVSIKTSIDQAVTGLES